MTYFIIAILIVLADQAAKYLVTLKLALGGDISIIPGIIHITYIRNTGAAFSILREHTWMLAAISIIAGAVIIFVIIKVKMGTPGRLALACVLGGAMGNLVDRLRLGYVVDMFEPEFVRFAIFNVADMFITVGGIAFCIYYIFYTVKSEKKAPLKTAPPVGIFDGSDKLTDTRILTEYEIDRLCSDKTLDPRMPEDDGDIFSSEENVDKDKS